MQEFYKKLADILEVETVSRDSPVEDFENWDSLGVLAILAMIDSTYKVSISSAEMTKVRKVADLEDIVKTKMAK